MTQTLQPKDEDYGLRLDQFLVKYFPGFSRGHWQEQIDLGLISIDGISAKKKVKVSAQPISIADKAFQVKTKIIRYPELQPKIIDEQTEFIIVHKPIGWITHRPNTEDKIDTELYLADWLAKKYPELKSVGETPEYRGGLVHRLDTPVSGLLVVARTPNSYAWLKAAFANRQVTKKYAALIYGEPQKLEGVIDFDIAKQAYGYMVARPKGKNIIEIDNDNIEDVESQEDLAATNAKAAETHYVVDTKWKYYALLTVTLITGRTHQIRVHLFASGMPIVGELKYIQKKVKGLLPPSRLMLQSVYLAFTDSQGQRHEYQEALDPDFQAQIDQLGAGIKSTLRAE